MFRRKLSSLPADFVFSASAAEEDESVEKCLERLGCFLTGDDDINNDNDDCNGNGNGSGKDQIRLISDPELPFHYDASKNARFLETRNAAMNACIVRIVMNRLAKLGVTTLILPIGVLPDEPHVPILRSANLGGFTLKKSVLHLGIVQEMQLNSGQSAREDLVNTKVNRIIAYFGDAQELGIISARIACLDNISDGTVFSFVREALAANALSPSSPSSSSSSRLAEDEVGVVIANPGQLIWNRRQGRAVSIDGWHALPRKSAAHESITITDRNLIDRNESPEEHMRCVFDEVLAPLGMLHGCKISVIAVGHSVDDLINFLDSNWEIYGDCLDAIACTSANACEFVSNCHNQDFTAFWGRRARLYINSTEVINTPLTGRKLAGCNVYSSGVTDFAESIMPRAYKAFLDYFKRVHHTQDYANPPQEIPSEAGLDDEFPDWDDSRNGEVNRDIVEDITHKT